MPRAHGYVYRHRHILNWISDCVFSQRAFTGIKLTTQVYSSLLYGFIYPALISLSKKASCWKLLWSNKEAIYEFINKKRLDSPLKGKREAETWNNREANERVQQSDSAEVSCSPHFIHSYFYRATKRPLVLQDMTDIQTQTLKSLHLCRQVSVTGLKWIKQWIYLFNKKIKTPHSHEHSASRGKVISTLAAQPGRIGPVNLFQILYRTAS